MLDVRLSTTELRVPTAAVGRKSLLSDAERGTVKMAIDSIFIGLCFLATLPVSPNKFLVVMLTVIILQVAFSLINFYNSYRYWTLWQVPYETFKGLSLGLIILAAINYVFPSQAFRFEVVSPGLIMSFLAMAGWRMACFSSFSRLPRKRTLILGADSFGQRLASEVGQRTHAGYELVGFVDDKTSGHAASSLKLPVVGTITDLVWLTQLERIDTILVDRRSPIAASAHGSLFACVENGLTVVPAVTVFEQLCGRVAMNNLSDEWFVFELKERHDRLYRLAKRSLDLVVACVGLAITGLFFPFVAVGIKLFGGPGPLLYSQLRMGLRGEEFRMYKFRTMVQSAETNGAVWAAVGDSRVTAFGRFLRRSRLDELPQFLNVLLGQMSIVGPRPERPEFLEMLEREIPYFNRRHMVIPGLTGWAQVNFPYGASIEDTVSKLEYDLYYIKNRSFFLDLNIMVKTIGVMMRKFGGR